MARKTITEELKNEIIDYYLDYPKTISSVAEKFGLSNPTIIKILKDVPKHRKAVIKNPELREDYFGVIDEERKAYFLGLIVSDGNVFVDDKHPEKRRQASISITLDLADEYLLEIFKNEVKTNTVIAKDGRGCGQIALRSDKMASDLEKHGVTTRKSFNTRMPENIPTEFLRHFVRGVFDGDGSILAKKHGTRFIHSLSFCGTHRLMSDIAEKLSDLGLLSFTPKVYDYKGRQLSELKIQRKDDIVSVCDWMYEGATVCMTRKKEKFDFLKEFYGNSEVSSEIAKGSETP